MNIWAGLLWNNVLFYCEKTQDASLCHTTNINSGLTWLILRLVISRSKEKVRLWVKEILLLTHGPERTTIIIFRSGWCQSNARAIGQNDQWNENFQKPNVSFIHLHQLALDCYLLYCSDFRPQAQDLYSFRSICKYFSQTQPETLRHYHLT